jgi:hypothetical protein
LGGIKIAANFLKFVRNPRKFGKQACTDEDKSENPSKTEFCPKKDVEKPEFQICTTFEI